jgi:uncharacterized protein (DUF1697 family)
VARQVALLRGINLGARNRVAMADLRELVQGLGYEDVKTLLQSGNVAYTTGEAAATAGRKIADAVRSELGVDAGVVVRTKPQLAAVLKRDALGDVATDPKRYLVMFLADKAPAKALADVDPEAYAPERFAVHGREIYIWYPNGVQRAKLSHAFWEKRIGGTGTARNWSTVEKLLELAST